MKKNEILNLTDKEVDKKIKLVGTKFDRRRRVTDKQIKQIKALIKQGKTQKYVADKFNVSVSCVRYHTDPIYKADVNYMRSFYEVKVYEGALAERAEYKRNLIDTNKIKVSSIN